MISKRKSSRAQATRKWSNGKIETAKRKRRRKSTAGLTRWRQAVSTTIRKSAISSAKKSRNLDSIPQRLQHSSGWKSTTESVTRRRRLKKRRLHHRPCQMSAGTRKWKQAFATAGEQRGNQLHRTHSPSQSARGTAQ